MMSHPVVGRHGLIISLWLRNKDGILEHYKFYPDLDSANLDRDYANDQNIPSVLYVRKYSLPEKRLTKCTQTAHS